MKADGPVHAKAGARRPADGRSGVFKACCVVTPTASNGDRDVMGTEELFSALLYGFNRDFVLREQNL